MTERSISLLLLAVAVAHLATDVLHRASEPSPRRNIDEPVPIPARLGAQEMPRPPPRDDPPAAAIDGRSGTLVPYLPTSRPAPTRTEAPG
jgi:hypothetical protein